MKKKLFIYTLTIVALSLTCFSCSKDNYDAPSSTFNGRIVYQGEPINVEVGQVNFELWQPGFGANGAIPVNVAQDGAFSSLLFNGNYKLIFTENQGPFYWNRNASGAVDTVELAINGSKTMDIEVTPYYMIRNAQISVSGNTVNATCAIEKIITDANARDVERISLYINKTQFVSANGTQNISKADIDAASISNPSSIRFSAAIPDIVPTQNYVFARIGLKLSGIDDMIFSPLEKLTF